MPAVELVLRCKGRVVTGGNSLQDDEQGFGRAAMDKDGLNRAHFHSAGEKMKMVFNAKIIFEYT